MGAGAGSTFAGTGATIGMDGNSASATFATANNTDVVNDYAPSATVIGALLVQLTTNNQTLLAGSVAETINDFGSGNFITSNYATINSITKSGTVQALAVGGISNTIETSAGETITFAASASAQVEGAAATIVLGNGDAIGLASTGNVIDDLGTSDAITGGGQAIGLDLAGNQTLATGTGAETIIDYGSNNVLTADNSSISMMSKAAELTLIGSDNTASAMANQTISLNSGTSNTFGVTTGDTVVLSASTSATLTGSSATISAAAGSQATLDGLSYSYADGTGAAGTGVVTGASSGGLIASSPGLTVNLGAGSHWTLNGGSAAVNAAAASQVTLNGGGYAYADPTGAAGTGVTAGAASSGVIASSPGLTANVGANAIWTFNGGSAVVNAAPQSQVTLQNGGGYDYADGGGAAGTGVVAGPSSTGIINGSVGLTANIGASASYILNGGAFAINASAGSYTDLNTGSGYVIAGNNCVIGLQADVAASVGGSGITLAAGNTGSNVIVQNNSSVTTTGDGGALFLSKSDTATITNSCETINGAAPITTGSAGVATSDAYGNIAWTFNGNPNEQVLISATGTWADQIKDPNGTTPTMSGNQGNLVNEEIINHAVNGQVVEVTDEETTYLNGKATGNVTTEQFYDPANAYGWSQIDRVFNSGGAFVTQTIYNRNGTAVGEAPVSGTVVSVGAYNPSGVETATGEYNVSDGQLGSVVSGSSLASVLASNDANSPADLSALTFALNAQNNTVAGLTPNGIGIAVQGAINSDYFVSLPPNSIPAPVASSDLSAQEVLINQLNNVDYVNQSDVTNSIGQDQNIYVPQSGGDLSFTTYSNGGDASPASLASPSLAAPMSGTVAAVAINVSGHAVSTTPEATATASFDATDDGGRVPIGWITSGEGLLITDPNGSLTSLSGANLVQSFAALKALDVGHTGSLNVSDPGWASLRVWEPASSGAFNEADVKTLAQLGITAIDLNPVLSTMLNNGNLIYGTDTATLNGHAASIAQLGLSYDPSLLHPVKVT